MLDHIIYQLNYGCQPMPQSDAPTIPHPVILGDGMHFWCLSTSPAADGTRASDWYKLDFSGVRAVCSCPGFTYRGECSHIGLVLAQMDALCKARTAGWEAERIARRGQSSTDPGTTIVPPPVKRVLYCEAQDAYLLPDEPPAA
jgi:hypothetical protein